MTMKNNLKRIVITGGAGFVGTNLIKITNNQIIMHALYSSFFVKNIFDEK